MKGFIELIKRKKIGTFLISLFFFIIGLLIVILGLSMLWMTKTAGETDISVPMIICIFGAIVLIIGYAIPKVILKLDKTIEQEKENEDNEKRENIKNIKGIRLATSEEKENYITNKKIKKKISFQQLLLICLIFWTGIIFIIVNVVTNIGNMNLLLVGILLVIIGTIIFFTNRNSNKKEINKIMQSNVYIADCVAFERKIKTYRYDDYIDERRIHRNITLYLIRITDGEYKINKWFSIDSKYYNEKELKVKLYVSDEIDVYDILVAKE